MIWLDALTNWPDEPLSLFNPRPNDAAPDDSSCAPPVSSSTPEASDDVPSASALTASDRFVMPLTMLEVSGISTTDEYGSAAICAPGILKFRTLAVSVKSAS